MGLLNFDTDLFDATEKRKATIRQDEIDNLKSQGKSEYEIDRILEMKDKKPDELKSYPAAEVKQLIDVTFYFTPEEYEQFRELFDVLEYKGNNSTQNWLLLGLLNLVKEGKIQYSKTSKEVWKV